MNDDIKQILECMKQYGSTTDLVLLDYITNLEQEVKELNESITWWSNRFKVVERDKEHISKVRDEIIEKYNELQQENEDLNEENELVRCDIHNAYSSEKAAIRELEDYKSRCEKAIEYINSTTFFGLRSGKTFMSKYLNDLLNILRGDDE